MIRGVAIILLFLFLGNAVSFLLQGVVPGSVCGMMLLFGALYAKWINPCHVASVANTLTQNMALFFVPAGVGLMASYKILSAHWIAILTVSIATTLLVIASVGLTQQKLEKRNARKEKKR